MQCIVTSPPYWGLRKYSGEQDLIWSNGTRTQGIVRCNRGDHLWQTETRAGISGGQNQGDKTENPNGATNRPVPASENSICTLCGAWRGAFGLEPTIEMYVAHTLEILRECRRVLRPDGVLFWNLGDSYCNGTSTVRPASKNGAVGGWSGEANQIARNGTPAGIKPKDLCLIPHRVALAAQADVSVRNGKQESWWVRSMIVWTKPNPMPESVTDRPTDAYEYIIMLTKSERYYWDADAVREETTGGTHSRGNGDGGPKAQSRGSYENWTDGTRAVLTTRNMRNVWTFATQPYPEAHFATFPEELPRRCIRAATSERGACAQCGAPWERVTKSEVYGSWHNHADDAVRGNHNSEGLSGDKFKEQWRPPQTIGWTPTCVCPGQHGHTVPCVVLDPFTGSGTTGKVAMELGRRFVGMDLAYHELSRERIESGIPGTAAWIREKNGTRLVPDAVLPLFAQEEVKP